MEPFNLLSFPVLLASLTLYFLADLSLRTLYRRYKPTFYDQLHSIRKDIPYFAFVLGWLITLFSTPACIIAASSDKPLTTSTAGQICLLSRATLWTSEFNRLSHASGYIYHHLGAVGQLVYQLSNPNLPMKPVYIIYASLATELFSSAGCALAQHGYRAANSKLGRIVQTINAWLLVLLRLPAWAYGLRFLKGLEGVQLWVCMGIMAVYGQYIVKMIIGHFKRLEIMRSGAISFGRLTIHAYWLFVTLAYTLSSITALSLFNLTSNSPNLAAVALLNQAFFAAGFGARLPEIISRHGFQAIFSKHVFATSGFWFQGGLSAAVLAILFSPFSPMKAEERLHLLAAGSVAMLLAEGIGRVGCYFAGCCGARNRLPAPLLSAALNIVTFAVVIAVYIPQFIPISIYQAAAVALGTSACIRLLVDLLRTDLPRLHSLRPTSIFAGLQLALALRWFLVSYAPHGLSDSFPRQEFESFLEISSLFSKA